MPYRTDGSSALDDYDDSDFSGDSQVDDEWTSEAAGTSDRGYEKIIPFPSRNNEDDDAWGNKFANREHAKRKAKDGEDKASGESDGLTGKNGQGIAAAKNAENAGGGAGGAGFSNNVAGKAAKAVPGSKQLTAKLKKLGPIGTILIVIGMLSGLFTASQTMAPFSLISNLMDNYNALRTSMNTRSHTMMTRLIKGGKNTSIMRTSIFGKQKFKLSSRMQTKFKKNGVYYDADSRTMYYQDPDTLKMYGISADESTKGNIKSSIDFVDSDGKSVHFDVDDNGKFAYNDLLDMNDNFYSSSERSTRTMKGHIAAWFDSISEKFHQRIGNSRNRLTVADGADPDTIEAAAKTGGMAEDSGDPGDTTADRNPTDPDNSDPDAARNIDVDDPDVPDTSGQSGALTHGMSEADVKTALTARAKSAAAAFGKAANIANVASIGCAALKVVNSIISTITALQKAQILNFGTGFFESVSKAQVGDSSTEVMYYMNKMTVQNPEDNNSTAFGSNAMAQTFSAGAYRVSPDDPYAKSISTTHISNLVRGGGSGFTGKVMDGIQSLGGSLQAYKGCVDLQFISGILGILASVADIVAGVLSAGIWTVLKNLLFGFLKAAAMSAIIAGIMSFVSSVMVPYVAKMLARDLIGEEGTGALLGYASDSAANMYMGEQMQSASGTPGTESSVLAQFEQTQEVIAQEARYIRLTHSPFDVSTPYTFLGSIVNQLTPLAMTNSGPLAIVSNVASLVGTSIGKMSPAANAISVVNFRTSLSHECGPLSNVTANEDGTGEDVVCDAYGNPYFVTNLSTMGNDAADVMDRASTYYDSGDTMLMYYMWQDSQGVWHTSSHRVPAERKNFVRGYYGEFSNFTAEEIDYMKKVKGYEWSNEEGENTFYVPGSPYRILKRPVAEDDGESAEGFNPEVREKSELAKYILACEVRQSSYGQEDSQVSAYITGASSSTLGQIADSLIGSIPIVGSVLDIARTEKEKKNIQWVSGENCVYDKFKHYARYSEDQRALESAEIVSTSSISVFLDDYYAENPIDYSLEGTLARYSGQTKEDINYVLGIVEYTEFIAAYDASEYGPNWTPKPDGTYVYESETFIAQIMPDVIKPEYIVFDKLRYETSC